MTVKQMQRVAWLYWRIAENAFVAASGAPDLYKRRQREYAQRAQMLADHWFDMMMEAR